MPTPPLMPPLNSSPLVPPDATPAIPPILPNGLNFTAATLTDPAALPNVGQMVDPPTGMLLGYGQTIDYVSTCGLTPVEPAGVEGTPVEFIKVVPGSCVKVITAISLAVGMQAPLPSPCTGSDNDVQLSQRVSSFSPGRTIDGSKVYGCIVQYVYGLKLRPGPSDTLDMGSTPIDSDPPAVNVLQPSSWLSYLTAPASPVSGGGGGGCGC